MLVFYLLKEVSWRELCAQKASTKAYTSNLIGDLLAKGGRRSKVRKAEYITGIVRKKVRKREGYEKA